MAWCDGRASWQASIVVRGGVCCMVLCCACTHTTWGRHLAYISLRGGVSAQQCGCAARRLVPPELAGACTARMCQSCLGLSCRAAAALLRYRCHIRLLILLRTDMQHFQPAAPPATLASVLSHRLDPLAIYAWLTFSTGDVPFREQRIRRVIIVYVIHC